MAAAPTAISMVSTPPRASQTGRARPGISTQIAVTSPVPMYQFAPVTSPVIPTLLAPQASSPPTKLNLPVRDELQKLLSRNSHFEPSDERRPVQALPRASNVVAAQVAAFSEEAKMVSRRHSSISQAPEPSPLISTVSNVSEVMSFLHTPLSSSVKVINVMAQAPAVVPASNCLPKVLSSPSEADPLMWSHGFNSLGSYMAAKAMGKLPEYSEALPPPSTMLTGPSTFFDVDLEKVGLSPLPLVTPDTDLSKEIPTPPCEPGSLTAGLADPETVERCRDSYNRELDRQLQDATRKLEQANAEKKHRLREEARRLREQYNAEVENELLEQARVVVERFSDRMAVLQEEADRQHQRLEKEAQELMKESQRYYHFKAKARRLLGSSASMMPSFMGRGLSSPGTGYGGYGGYGHLPRWDHEDLPAFPTFSQRSPNLQDLLNGASNPLYGSAPPPPPPPPKLHGRDMPPPSNTSLAPPAPLVAPKLSGPATAPMAPPSPVGPTAQAVPVMAPIRCQSTVSAGVSPMSATRFLQTVNRGTQAGSPPGPSPVATFHGASEWTPPETPRPCAPVCPSAPLHMCSRSPLGALQVPQGSTKVWHPAPRGVSQQFTNDMFYPQGDFMGNLANPIPIPYRTGMSDLSEKVTSV